MRPSPSGWRLGPRGYSFSRPQRVYLCYGPVTRSLPWGDFVDRLQSFSFHHLCYPNYGALTSTPAGLSPAEHASLHWTHNRACRFPAPGFPTGFTARHTTAGRSLLVSGDDTSARDGLRQAVELSLKAPDFIRRCQAHHQSPSPHHLQKRTRSRGPSLRRHYPASMLLLPRPTPAVTTP